MSSCQPPCPTKACMCLHAILEDYKQRNRVTFIWFLPQVCNLYFINNWAFTKLSSFQRMAQVQNYRTTIAAGLDFKMSYDHL